MDTTKISKVLSLAQEAGVIRPRDLASDGIPRAYLARLCQAGKLQRVGHGLYMLANGTITTNHSLAEAAKRMPNGVVCLLSALRFHGVTTQAPFEVWIAIDNKARAPTDKGTPLRIVRFSGKALQTGIETHMIDSVPTKIYSLAKTVADCFKFRNKIGMDVALEALRESWRTRKYTMDELWHYATICRVTNVMRPYLETLT
ncbi:MAG: type IV toxin-antitoxin system AbiEi family antitoxin domain-containing protein [Sulfuriferula sp.]